MKNINYYHFIIAHYARKYNTILLNEREQKEKSRVKLKPCFLISEKESNYYIYK